MTLSRRSFLGTAIAAELFRRGLPRITRIGWFTAPGSGQASATGGAIPRSFPSHDPDLAREMVSVSHGNAQRVRELLSNRPALAKAVWDWGYGDWETALGGASHVGNREIAELLISAGAPPTIFSAAMLGQLTVVQGIISATPGVQRAKGPHGISLLSHAKAGNASEVVKYLESLGDADPRYKNEPLSEADRAAILGTYTYGPATPDRLTVLINTRGALMIQREGAVGRNLFHLGERVFHPSGAEDVRIRFGAGEPATTLRIEDGPVVVAAKRLQAVPLLE